MEMKKINSGKLRAIGYDARARGCCKSNSTTAAHCNTAAWARIYGAVSAARGRHGASIATTSRKSSLRRAFPAALPQARTRLTSYSGNPERVGWW